VEKLRYIHRNPVRRGLVAKLEDWRWSSFRHYATGLRGTVEIESEWTARERGWQLPEWVRYQRFDSPSPVPKSEGVKCRDMLYILSPDILYTCCQPVKRRQALLESNLAEE
jgi:hypothetical protein